MKDKPLQHRAKGRKGLKWLGGAVALLLLFLGATHFILLDLRDRIDHFSLTHGIPPQHYNAIHHSYASLVTAEKLSAPVAEFLGFMIELAQSWEGRYEDRYKDLWNNAIGRQLAAYARETGLPREALLLDAYHSGQLIRHEDEDDRGQAGLFDYPRPVYSGPSADFPAIKARFVSPEHGEMRLSETKVDAE